MPYYVYIIQSQKDNTFYKGFSKNYLKRIDQHNNAESKFTRSKIPWKLVYLEVLPTKREALIRERNLKKADHKRIIALIDSPKNLLNKNP